jgi:hypothetical protein
LSSSVATVDASAPEPPPLSADPASRRFRPVDAAVAAGYLGLALLVTWPLWRGQGVIRDNRDDPIFFQWMLTHAARIFTDGDNPLLGEQFNAPFGVNLMANTSILALGIPLIPVTLLAGPWISYLVLTMFAYTATAYAWYHVLSRYLVPVRVCRPEGIARHGTVRAAAIIGGGFCAFSPGMISQGVGHPNIVCQFLVPFIVLTVLRMRDPDKWRRNGLILAALVLYQTFINEEVLFLTALVLFVFVTFYLVQRRDEAKRAWLGGLKAFGLCFVVVAAVLAYPLYWQFYGPSAYHGLPPGVREFGTDLMAANAFARESLLGSVETSYRLASSGTEENTFFGTPLLWVLAGVAVIVVRSAGARALIATLILFWAFSLGPHIRINGRLTTIPGPWYPLSNLPLFDSVVATRLGIALTPMVGVLLALSIDKFELERFRRLWIVVVIAALIPIAPTPLSVAPPYVRPTPAFYAAGTWRQHVPADGVVLTVPPGWVPYLEAMAWQIDQRLEFSIVGGYFLAPAPDDPTKRANFGPSYPPTMRLLWYIGEGGGRVYISDEHRRLAIEDFRTYRITTLVMPTDTLRAADLHATLDQLIGPGQEIDDVWVWDVRSFAGTG